MLSASYRLTHFSKPSEVDSYVDGRGPNARKEMPLNIDVNPFASGLQPVAHLIHDRFLGYKDSTNVH